MSADTPRDPGMPQPPHADRGRPAEPDHGRAAEQAPERQQTDAARSQQPVQTLNRADYNAARHAEPPIQRQADGKNHGPADAAAPAAGNGGDRRAEHPAPRQAHDAGARGPEGAGTLSRADYNAARHAEPPIRSHETAAEQQKDNGGGPSAESKSESATESRPTAAVPEARPGHRPDASHEARQKYDGGTVQMPDSPARKPADESAAARNPDRSDELAEGKSRASGQDPDVHPAITHFHSEFKGQSTDLYTDGTQWALGNQPPKEDLSAGRRETPERLPTGEDLVESAGEESSLSEKLRREIYEEAEDLTDAIETNTNNAYDVFAPPQTGSHQETPGPEPHFTTQQHPGMDLGTGVTALFVLGVTIDRGARWVMQHLEKHPEGD